jgi:hypothetical protein
MPYSASLTSYRGISTLALPLAKPDYAGDWVAFHIPRIIKDE